MIMFGFIKLIILIILYILIDKVFYPKFRGFMGEFWVKQELKKLVSSKYKVLNNIMVKVNNETYQVDHIVISEFGVFVIEMKNYYGVIKGSEYDNNWIQKFKRKKYYFKNPIHQNYGHICALSEILNIDKKMFHNIVCFSNQSKLKLKVNNSNIVQLDNLIYLIKEYKINLGIDVNKIFENIEKINILDKNERKKHVKKIKNKIKEKEEKVINNTCPKCGNKLIQKNGKYGNFIGCSNYPNCKYVKK